MTRSRYLQLEIRVDKPDEPRARWEVLQYDHDDDYEVSDIPEDAVLADVLDTCACKWSAAKGTRRPLRVSLCDSGGAILESSEICTCLPDAYPPTWTIDYDIAYDLSMASDDRYGQLRTRISDSKDADDMPAIEAAQQELDGYLALLEGMLREETERLGHRAAFTVNGGEESREIARENRFTAAEYGFDPDDIVDLQRVYDDAWGAADKRLQGAASE